MKKIILILLVFLWLKSGYGQPCWFSIDAGSFHSLAVKQDGTLWAWGYNGAGGLGLGNSIDKNVPTKVGTASNWQEVYAGRFSSYAIKQDGTLWAWGYNGNGELGLGHLIDKSIPTQVGTATDWMQITAGGLHAFGIKTDGSLWGWGDMGVSGLGDGTSLTRLIPTRIGTQIYASVSTGKSHTLAIRSDRKLFSWGGGFSLGNNPPSGINIIPTQIGSDNWEFVSAGNSHSLGVKSDNSLWAWGQNYSNQLGDGTSTDRITPVRIGIDNDWYEVHAGEDVSRGIRSSAIFTGKIYGWGYTVSLGQPSSTNLAIPTQNGTSNNWFRMSKFTGTDAGNYPHNLWLDYTGTIYGAGRNEYGQIGDGTTVYKPNLTPISCGSVLPIKLTSFTAKNNTTTNLLNWITENETNNQYFEIQHSLDGTNFKPIGKVNGQLNSSNTHNYNFTHNTPSNDINYYRLKQVDVDGKFTYSKIVSVTNANNNITIYPNPVSSELYVKNAKNKMAFSIVNNVGQIVLSGQHHFLKPIQTTILSKGIYFLKIDGSVFKFLKL